MVTKVALRVFTFTCLLLMPIALAWSSASASVVSSKEEASTNYVPTANCNGAPRARGTMSGQAVPQVAGRICGWAAPQLVELGALRSKEACGSRIQAQEHTYWWVRKKTSTYYYVYHVYKTSTGIVETYVNSVNSADYEVELTVWYEPSVSKNYIGIVPYGGSPSTVVQSTATESIWQVLQTGMRMMAAAGSVTQDQFYTRNHHWRCGSCGNTWIYQSSDGSRLSQGPSVASWDDWWEPLPSWSSDGGWYYAACPQVGYSSCP